MASTSFNKFSSDSNLKPVMTEVNGYVHEVSDDQVAKSEIDISILRGWIAIYESSLFPQKKGKT